MRNFTDIICTDIFSWFSLIFFFFFTKNLLCSQRPVCLLQTSERRQMNGFFGKEIQQLNQFYSVLMQQLKFDSEQLTLILLYLESFRISKTVLLTRRQSSPPVVHENNIRNASFLRMIKLVRISNLQNFRSTQGIIVTQVIKKQCFFTEIHELPS